MRFIRMGWVAVLAIGVLLLAAVPALAVRVQRMIPVSVQTDLPAGSGGIFTFKLFETRSGGMPLHEERPVRLRVGPDGTVSYELGRSARISASVDFSQQLWVQLSESYAAKPRIWWEPLRMAPYAMWSERTNTAPLDARYVQHEEQGAVSGPMIQPGSVTEDKITGPIGTAKLAVGTTAGTVAAGDHTHAAMGDIEAVQTPSGGGLEGGSDDGTASLSLLTSCSADEVLKWDGTAWACAADDVGTGGGTVTQVNTGTGLTGGPFTEEGTIAIDPAVVPRLGASNTFTGAQVMQASDPLTVALAVQGVPGQSEDLQHWRNSEGIPVAALSPGGVLAAVAFSGSGAGLTGVNAATLGGQAASAFAGAAHAHSGEDIASGTVATVRLSVGTSAGTVAAGDHAHDAAYVNEGQANAVTSTMIATGAVTDAKITGPIATTKLNVGTSAGTVAAGDHQHAGMGDITAVNTAAGSGLTGGAAAGDANLAVVAGSGIVVDGSGVSVSFGGPGSVATAARSDHDHGVAGVDNTAVGSEALQANTSGSGNTAAGDRALRGNLTGANNSAFGAMALQANASGDENTAVGASSLVSATTGLRNTAVGFEAMRDNISGSYNTAVGVRALVSNTDGIFNTAVGEVSLNRNTSGQSNAAVGNSALRYNTTGSENSAFGAGSLYFNSSGSENTASGFQALFSNTLGAKNTASGYKALHANVDGYNNTATGAYSLFANVAGVANTADGFFALNANTANFNTAIGDSALRFNTTGESNTAAGFRALVGNTEGAGNAAVGVEALASNATGGGNTAVGFRSLVLNPAGGGNTAVGSEALSASLAGDANTALGSRAAASLTGGLGNTFLGAGADAAAPSLERATALGYNARVGSSNSLVLGGTGADAVKVGIGTATPGQDLAAGSLALDVHGRSRLVGSPGATADTAGTWLSTIDAGTVTDRAFVGLKDDGFVGFYGAAGSDWSLLMDTATGEVLAGKDVRIAGTATMSGFNLSTAPGDGYVLMSDASGNGSWQPIVGSAGGTVTQVNTGAGLAGGPVTVVGTISVATGGIANSMIADGAVTNAKITGPIATSKLSVGTTTGTVAAGDHAHPGMGDITAVNTAPGSGLTGGAESDAVSLAVDTGTIQARVSGTCAPGSSIRSIAADGTVTCETDDIGDGGGGSAWSLTGNAGTNPATNFIGTTDDTALEFRVNNQRALRLERVTTSLGGATYTGHNAVGGDAGNYASSGVTIATIGGGGGTGDGTPFPNRVTDVGGTVGGGLDNQAGDGQGSLYDNWNATVAGGRGNKASGYNATVGGGWGNEASGGNSTVGGGFNNKASGWRAFVGGGANNESAGSVAVVAGGQDNWASGYSAAVPGGVFNIAGGDYSLAAGQRAQVRTPTQSEDPDGDEGTFVWADATLASFRSTGPNQFLIRAGGGVGINKNNPRTPLDVNGTITAAGAAGGPSVIFSGTGAQLTTQQGGSIELGASDSVANAVGAMPYIDFHYGTGAPQDYNVRLINYSNRLLYLDGNLDVYGTLSKASGSFKIDHPLDPKNRYLSHSFVESPDMMNIYNGNVTTDGRGYATVELPAWFGALNRDFRYQLTVVDEADGEGFVQAKVVRGVAENRFTLRTSAPGVTVSWQVTGIRQDPYANAHRIPVEEEKPVADRGRCLHAEACGEQLAQGR